MPILSKGIPTFEANRNRFYIWAKGPDGKRARKAYGKTAEAALAERKRIEEELRASPKPSGLKLTPQANEAILTPGTYADFIYRVYCPHVYDGAAPRTVETYDSDLRYHILPILGHLQTSAIGYEDMLTLKASLRPRNRKGVRIEDGALSPSKSRDLLSRVKESLSLAHSLGLTHREDWRVIKMPIKPKKKKRSERDADFPTKLMAEAKKCGRPWMVGILFAGQYLGLREGEACGLRKDRIDRKNLTITIDTQRQYIRGVGFVDRPVKGSKGEDGEISNERVLGVPLELIEWLDQFSVEGCDYVFANNAKMPCNPRTVCEMTPALCLLAGLPRTTFHDLRSYAASNLIALGYDIVTVSSVLGHTNIQTSLIYVNVQKEAQRKALKGLIDTIKDVDKPADSNAQPSTGVQ